MTREVEDEVHFIPAGDDWYFTHAAPNKGDPAVFHRVALWRVEQRKTITGMIGVDMSHLDDSQGVLVRLGEPPRLAGAYVHRSTMTKKQLEDLALRQG